MARPAARSRFSQALLDHQTALGLTDRQVAEKHHWLPQTFSRWKLGSLPRDHMFGEIAAFLGISAAAVRELVEEAMDAAVNTKVTRVTAFNTARVYGRVTDRKEGKYVFEPFNRGRKRIPEGRYCVLIDTKVMEPALLVGTKAWLDPGIWPAAGNEVMVHAKGGAAWIGRLVSFTDGRAEIERSGGSGTLAIRDVEAVHVVVLAERVVAAQ